MVQFFSKCLGASMLLASAAAAPDSDSGCNNRVLTYPEVVDMDDISAAGNILTLDLDWLEINPGFGDQLGDDADNATAPVCGSTSFMTRALGGSVPGPTLTVSPGTTMRVTLRNKLTYQPDSYSSRVVVAANGALEGEEPSYATTTKLDLSRLNKFNDPDVANLHFHGLHVSGVLPSDDTTLEVLPQEEYEYVIEIPEHHEPGLHWVHPHHHGSSTLQLVGGAALALIVKDPNEDGNSTDLLPVEVREATERVLVFQDWDIKEALQTARHAGDNLLTESFSQIEGGEAIGQRFVTVNGKYQPITDIPVGKWERWRILYAGWQDLPLQFGILPEEDGAGCEFYLLAKDGIYLSDYPRGPMMATGGEPMPIPPGGRADFMVRCNKVGGTTRFEALSRKNVLTVNCVEDDDAIPTTPAVLDGEGDDAPIAAVVQRSATPLTPWRKTSSDLPEYLQAVDKVTASDGCACETVFDGYDDTSRVNGQIYRPGNNFMHTTYLGAVVERSLKGMHEHSYHQHVYPYQLVSFPDQDSNEGNEFFKIGDWHDTYLDKNQKSGPVTIRYKTTDIPGKIMVHCHNTLHADSGMIQKEYIRDVEEGGRCECEIFGSISGEGIVDDIDNPKVIGAMPAIEDSSGRRGVLLGATQLVPVLVVAGALLGFGV